MPETGKDIVFRSGKVKFMYTTKQGQAWDQIAKEVYGKETLADFLMESNPKLLNVFVFPAGINIKTPALPESRKDLPPWR